LNTFTLKIGKQTIHHTIQILTAYADTHEKLVELLTLPHIPPSPQFSPFGLQRNENILTVLDPSWSKKI
jgi:hypothetical protein